MPHIPRKLLMQLHHCKMVLSVAENAKMHVKILEERLLVPGVHMRKRALVILVFAQLLQLVNLSHCFNTHF